MTKSDLLAPLSLMLPVQNTNNSRQSIAKSGPKIYKVDMKTHEKTVSTTVIKEIFLKHCTELEKGIKCRIFFL